MRQAINLILRLLAAVALAVTTQPVAGQLTLEQCIAMADANYPLIKQYDLVARTTALDLSDINRSWLPSAGVYAQGTLQNAVPEFPQALSGVIQQMGADIKGLGKAQYKVGVDLSQNIWDGGSARTRRAVTRAQDRVSRHSLDVEMYAMHSRVEDLFFGILLMDRQIESTRHTLEVLEATDVRMRARVQSGVAMQCDADMIEAQILGLRQTLVQAVSAVDGYRRMLGLYIGEDIGERSLVMPEPEIPADMTSDRPELKLYDARLTLNSAARAAADAALMPRVGLFAQAYYGYPGLNYFDSMLDRKMSFNIVAGIKVSWTLTPLYTHRNALDRLAVDDLNTRNEREVFLFGTKLQTTEEKADIKGMHEVIKDDERIVALRAKVRRAAESQLENGVIDATDLLIKINDESQAQLNAACHRIQLIKTISQLKHTINR